VIVLPLLEYAYPVWYLGLTKEESDKIEEITLKKRSLKIIY